MPDEAFRRSRLLRRDPGEERIKNRLHLKTVLLVAEFHNRSCFSTKTLKLKAAATVGEIEDTFNKFR